MFETNFSEGFKKINNIKQMNNITEVNGYIGGILSAIIFIPQIYKMFLTKSARDISWTFLFVSNIGSIFSLVYYFEIDAKPMIYTNIFSLFTRIFMTFYKFYLDNYLKEMEDEKIDLINDNYNQNKI